MLTSQITSDGVPSATKNLASEQENNGPETAKILPTNIHCRSNHSYPNEAPPIRLPGYDILGVIGSGGMGIVFKARHHGLNRIVALKMLSQAGMLDSEARERFQVEAEAVAKLQHPNIIQVFDVGAFQPQPGEICSNPYISLEFVDGGSLHRHTLAPQSPQFAAQIVEKLARAVHAAHQVGVVHRDLKPANVLLTREWEPKIADFGLAKYLNVERDHLGQPLTQAGMAVGTPEYMAPEQIDSKTPTPAIDIYALGVILYELLTSHAPFKGETLSETLYLVKHQEPVSPRRLQPKLPRDLETICLKCLSKSPHQRYPTAAALADDLSAFLEGRTIQARPVGRLVRLWRWAKRNPSVASLSVLTLLIAIAGISAVMWKWQEAIETNRAERWERYRANISVASSSLPLNNLVAARRGIEACPEEYRNWEWDYLSHQLDMTQEILNRPDEKITGATLPPNSSRVLIDSDRRMRVWDILAKRQILALESHSDEINWKPSRDGTFLACIHKDFSVAIKDLTTGEVLSVFRGHRAAIDSVWFSSETSRIVTSSDDGMVYIWDRQTGREIAAIREYSTRVMVFDITPNGKWIATQVSGQDAIHLWDVDTLQKAVLQNEHEKHILGGQFSPTNDRFITFSRYPIRELRLWDTQTGKFVELLKGHGNQIKRVEYSPNGQLIASSSMDQTVRLWSAKEGKLLHTLRGHAGWVNVARFSSDGKRIISGAQDQTIRIWDTSSGTELGVLRGHTGEILDLAYSPDNSLITSASKDGTLRTWDARTTDEGGICYGHTSFVYSVVCSRDGKQIASASWDGTVRVWDLPSRREVMRLDHGSKTIVSSVSIHPDGKILASVARDDTIRLWDLTTQRVIYSWKVLTEDWRDTRLTFSPDGNTLACGSKDQKVYLLNLETKQETILCGHTAPIRDVVFSPHGRWLASAAELDDKTVRIWDLTTNETIQVLDGHTDGVYSLAVSPDGRFLASGSSDGTVRLWNTSTWESTILHHGVNVYGIAFSPDGSRLATGCADNTIRLWDMNTKQAIVELRGHKEYIHSLTFTPDGHRLISGSGDHTIRIWGTGSRTDR